MFLSLAPCHENFGTGQVQREGNDAGWNNGTSHPPGGKSLGALWCGRSDSWWRGSQTPEVLGLPRPILKSIVFWHSPASPWVRHPDGQGNTYCTRTLSDIHLGILRITFFAEIHRPTPSPTPRPLSQLSCPPHSRLHHPCGYPQFQERGSRNRHWGEGQSLLVPARRSHMCV